MSFTNRFVSVPTSIFNIQTKELTGKEILYQIQFKFSLFDLAAYRTSYAESEPDKEITLIILKCGYEILIDLTVEEFEQVLNQQDI